MSAEGAESTRAWGDAPGEKRQKATSAESAIQSPGQRSLRMKN
jgi:hypothetical protein